MTNTGKLIDSDALIKRIYEDGKNSNNPSLMMIVGFVAGYVNKQPEAIVRCKDCKNGSDDHDPYLDIVWCRVHERRFDADWFCADGERRTE